MKEENSHWVCPNDRQLLLRSKLRAGWCVRTNVRNGKNVTSINGSLSPEEMKHIQEIIEKAELLERHEQERIGSLVQKLELMVQKSMGDGVKTCLLCSDGFGKFKRTTSIVCTECRKKVCEKCCIDYTSGKNMTDIKQHLNQQSIISRLWLCKICSENKEVWKRSGAWFFNTIPRHILPDETCPEQTNFINAKKSNNLLAADSPSHAHHHRTLSGNSVTSFQWAKPTARRESSDDESEEESSDDDGITLGKVVKSSSNASEKKISETDSYTTAATQSDDSNSRVGRNESMQSEKSEHVTPKRQFPFQTANKHLSEDAMSVDSRATEISSEDSADNLGSSVSIQSEDTNSITSEHYSKSAVDLKLDGSRGFLEFSILYDPLKCALHVTILKAKDLPSKDSNGFSDPYVKLHLLPGSNRATKLRTKTIKKNLNPTFNEKLSYYGIMESELSNRILRLTVLDEDRFGQNDFLGEVRVVLSVLSSSQTKSFNLPLQHKQLLDKCDEEATDPGRIHLGLQFSSKENALIVNVIRCSNLVGKNPNSTCNAYVKISLKVDENTTTHKTQIKKKNCNPEFNKEVRFKATSEAGHGEVARGNMMIQVLDAARPGAKQYMIGGLMLGINSEGAKLRHWFNCLKNPNKLFEEWHILETEKKK